MVKLVRKPSNMFTEVTIRAYQEMEVEEILQGKFKKARAKALNGKISSEYKRLPTNE